MSEWPEGKERRSANITLNDILLELREMKQEFKGEMKLIYERFDNHAKEDTQNFSTISTLIKSLTTTVSWLQKGFFFVIGGYALLQFLFQTNILSFDNNISSSNNSSGRTVYRESESVGRYENRSGKVSTT